MANRNLLISLVVGALFAGCTKPAEPIPSGPVEVVYSSVRGASPQVVDYYVVKSGQQPNPSVANADKTARIAVFYIPRETEGDLKRAVFAVMNECGWEKMASSPAKAADGSFRRLSIKVGNQSRVVEIHERGGYDVNAPLGDEEFKRFYHLVSAIRYLGETHGVRIITDDSSIAYNLGVPQAAANGR